MLEPQVWHITHYNFDPELIELYPNATLESLHFAHAELKEIRAAPEALSPRLASIYYWKN